VPRDTVEIRSSNHAMNRATRRAVSLATALLLAVAGLLATAAPAAARAELRRSEPAAGSVVPATVSEVSLEFTEPVTSPVVTITDSAGRRVDRTPQIMGNLVVVPLRHDVRDGRVTVRWRVTDGGGNRDGELEFTIAAISLESATASPEPDAATRTREGADRDSRAGADAGSRRAWAALRGAGLVGVLLAVGIGLFAVLVHDGARDRRRVALAGLVTAVAGCGLVAGAALLGGTDWSAAGRAVRSTDVAALRDLAVDVLRGQSLSRRETVSLGLLGAGSLLVVLGTGFGRRNRPVPRAIVLVGALAVGVSFASSGHAASSPSPVVAEAALGLHVLGMGAWLGGLVALALTLGHRRQVRTVQREVLLVHRYGTLAAISVTTGLLAGLALALLAVPRVSALWETRWGLVVGGKAAAVLVVVLLAVLIRGRPGRVPAAGVPAVRPAGLSAGTTVDDRGDGSHPGPSRRRLRIRLGAQALVLAAATAASAVLVQEDPLDGSREYLRVVELGRRVAVLRSDDLSAGRALVRVSLTSYGGVVDARVTRMSVRLSGPDGGPGRRYDLIRAAESETFDAWLDMPSAGPWLLQLSYVLSPDDRGDATIVLPVG
jgi:methionine-rich copper-binding protein CopC/putative copper export protein